MSTKIRQQHSSTDPRRLRWRNMCTHAPLCSPAAPRIQASIRGRNRKRQARPQEQQSTEHPPSGLCWLGSRRYHSAHKLVHGTGVVWYGMVGRGRQRRRQNKSSSRGERALHHLHCPSPNPAIDRASKQTLKPNAFILFSSLLFSLAARRSGSRTGRQGRQASRASKRRAHGGGDIPG